MAGSTHHMQMRMVNAVIRVRYEDGTSEKLELRSPDNWWPIEQDYFVDNHAFSVSSPRPPRFYLKTGEWHMDTYNVLKRNHTNRIKGGAASLLDVPLDPKKALKGMTLETITNDVVIGVMAATLKR